jgi:predicted DNA-binding WGR domain protein
MPVRRFEYTHGSSNKFWEIEQVDDVIRVRWGRIGAAGQTLNQVCASVHSARLQMQKKISSKLGKGYVEITGKPKRLVLTGTVEVVVEKPEKEKEGKERDGKLEDLIL